MDCSGRKKACGTLFFISAIIFYFVRATIYLRKSIFFIVNCSKIRLNSRPHIRKVLIRFPASIMCFRLPRMWLSRLIRYVRLHAVITSIPGGGLAD